MAIDVVRERVSRVVLILLLLCGVAEISFSSFAVQSVTLAWNASSDPKAVGYNIHYGTVSQNYTMVISAGNATTVTISNLTENTNTYLPPPPTILPARKAISRMKLPIRSHVRPPVIGSILPPRWSS